MQKISTFQIVLLSVFGALAVAAVIIFSFVLSQGTSSAVGPVSIWGTFDQVSIQKAIDDLSLVHPDLQNARYTQKPADSYAAALTEAFASGTGPDLFFLSEDEAYAQKSRIRMISAESLTRSQFENSFIDGALPFIAPEGILALPLLADPLVLYWNKDILAANGESQPPQYWDQLFDFARKVTKRTDDGTVQTSAIAFGTYDNVDHAKEIMSLLIFQAGGSITVYDTNGRLFSGLLADNPASGGLTAAPAAVRFFTGFADSSKPDYSWNRSLQNAEREFVAGRLALYIGLASEKELIRNANPNLNFAISSIPQIRGARTLANSGKVYGVAVAKNAQNPLGGFAVAALLAAADASQALANATGLTSARRDLVERARVQANPTLSASEGNIIANATILMRTWTDPDPQKTNNIFRDMIEETTSGALLLNEAISRAEQQINNLIEL